MKHVAALKTKLELWKAAFSSGDMNSVMQQVYRLTWNMAAFQVINEARRLSSDERGVAPANGLLHETFDDCFFLSQLSAYRRLNDGYSMHGCRGVWSLRSLLEDIAASTPLLSRKTLLVAYDYEYDYAEIERKHDAWFMAEIEQRAEAHGAFWVPKELNSYPSAYRHKVVDELCGVTAIDSREAGDVPRPDIIQGLLAKLDLLGPACDYVDKFVAHPASAESRYRSGKNFGITLNNLLQMQEVVSKIVTLTDKYFIDGGYTQHLSTPQFDQFQYLDKPLVSTGQLEQLRAKWEEYSDMVEGWGSVEMEWISADGVAPCS